GNQFKACLGGNIVALFQALDQRRYRFGMVVSADRKTHSTVMHHVDFNLMPVKQIKDLSEVIFHDKGKVFRQDRDHHLVYLKNEGGNGQGSFMLADGSSAVTVVNK